MSSLTQSLSVALLQDQVRDFTAEFPDTKEDHVANQIAKQETTITRQKLIERLNEDLSREYQAVIAYVVYSQVLKGAE
jgi:hypothetical protein